LLVWSGHSCPLPLTFALAPQNWLGELSCKERSDDDGQFAGKPAESDAAVAQEGAMRRPQPRRGRRRSYLAFFCGIEVVCRIC